MLCAARLAALRPLVAVVVVWPVLALESADIVRVILRLVGGDAGAGCGEVWAGYSWGASSGLEDHVVSRFTVGVTLRRVDSLPEAASISAGAA
jgi:hypothetical protein